jgi:hypothetical protein
MAGNIPLCNTTAGVHIPSRHGLIKQHGGIQHSGSAQIGWWMQQCARGVGGTCCTTDPSRLHRVYAINLKGVRVYTCMCVLQAIASCGCVRGLEAQAMFRPRWGQRVAARAAGLLCSLGRFPGALGLWQPGYGLAVGTCALACPSGSLANNRSGAGRQVVGSTCADTHVRHITAAMLDPLGT